MIYFLYLYTTIRQKYMVLSHLIIILYTTIQLKIKVFIDLFISCAHDHSTEIYIVFLCTTIQPRLRVRTYLIFLYATIWLKPVLLFHL